MKKSRRKKEAVDRLPDWSQRLTAFVAAGRARAHTYAEWDCLLMPAAAVEAVTGVDHGAAHRGRYNSHASASVYLRSLGHADAEALLDSLFPQKPVGFAQRGDLVLGSDGVPALCLGGFAITVIEGHAGYLAVARREWTKAWRIG